MAIRTAQELFSPISVQEFIDRYLEKEVLLIERDAGQMVKGQFDLDSLAECIRFIRPWHSKSIRIVPSGDDPEETAAVLAMNDNSGSEIFCLSGFANKKTIILNGAEDYWPSVRDLVMNLRETLSSNVKCNVYCTPPESQGFDTHVDAHDVLVLQTYGSKTWRIHDTQTELPIESSSIAGDMFPRLESSHPDYGEPSREVVLRSGDLLYLPRGVPHSAASTDDASIHFTIGLYPLRRHEFFSQMVDLLAVKDISLRRRLPVGVMRGEDHLSSAGDLLRELATIADSLDEPLDPNLVARINAESNANPGSTEGSMYSAINAENINLNTTVSRPEGCRFSWRLTKEEIRTKCGPSMSLPLKLTGVMPFLQEHPSFCVGDLPDEEITDSAKVVLIRNMVKNGLFRIDSVGEKPPMTAKELEATFAF